MDLSKIVHEEVPSEAGRRSQSPKHETARARGMREVAMRAESARIDQRKKDDAFAKSISDSTLKRAMHQHWRHPDIVDAIQRVRLANGYMDKNDPQEMWLIDYYEKRDQIMSPASSVRNLRAKLDSLGLSVSSELREHLNRNDQRIDDPRPSVAEPSVPRDTRAGASSSQDAGSTRDQTELKIGLKIAQEIPAEILENVTEHSRNKQIIFPARIIQLHRNLINNTHTLAYMQNKYGIPTEVIAANAGLNLKEVFDGFRSLKHPNMQEAKDEIKRIYDSYKVE